MSSEYKFWMFVIGCGVAFVLGMTTVLVVAGQRTDARVERLMKSGISGRDAVCAIRQDISGCTAR